MQVLLLYIQDDTDKLVVSHAVMYLQETGELLGPRAFQAVSQAGWKLAEEEEPRPKNVRPTRIVFLCRSSCSSLNAHNTKDLRTIVL